MAILIKQGEKYYEIPDEVLAKARVTKDKFEKSLRDMTSEMAEQTGAWKDLCNFLDLSACRISDL